MKYIIKDEKNDYSVKYDNPFKFDGEDVQFGHEVSALYGGRVTLDGVKNEETFNRDAFPIMEVLGEDWDCGHLLGKQLGGEARKENFIPMTHSSNMEFKASVEDKVAKVIEYFQAIHTYLATTHQISSTKLKYEVNVIPGKTFSKSIYTFPKTIYARLSIINDSGKEIDYNLLGDLKIYKDIDVQLPLSRVLNVDEQ